MTFADELRSSKGPQLTKEEIAGRQYWLNFHVKAVLEELKRLARSQNNAGKYSVSGYLAYDGYDKDYWRLLPIKDKLLPTTIYLWLISLTASKELSILLLKLLECR